MASGLALPVPAMSGAEPCTGSNSPGPEPSPSEALGSIPSEPVSIAASSLRMSPNMFSVRITSNSAGRDTSCIAALSTSMCSSGTSSPSPDAVDDLAPQPGRLEDVRLVHAGHLRAGELEADARDPLDLALGVDAGVVRGVAVEAAVAEVDAAGQLAHDQQVGALDPLALERARVEQRRAGPDRAQVGEQPEALAQAEQPLLGARPARVGGVPLGAADGGQQHGVGAPAGVEHLVGQRRAVRVDRGAADQPLVELEVARAAPARPRRRP